MAMRRARRKSAGFRPYQIHLTAAACSAADDLAGCMTGGLDTVATAPHLAQVLEDLLPALDESDVVSLAQQQGVDGKPVSPSAAAALILATFGPVAARSGLMGRIAALGPDQGRDRQTEMLLAALEIGLSIVERPSIAECLEAAQAPEEGRRDVVGETITRLRFVEVLEKAGTLAGIMRAPSPGAAVKDALSLQQHLTPMIGSREVGAMANLLWRDHSLAARQRLVAHVAEESITALFRSLRGMPQARENVAEAKTLRAVFDSLELAVAAVPRSGDHPLANLKGAFLEAANQAKREGRVGSTEQYLQETLCRAVGLPLPVAASMAGAPKPVGALPALPAANVEAEEIGDDSQKQSSGIGLSAWKGLLRW
ncbi:hypothetical protein AL072_32915 [Azospirillum thiophilum]|uniref:Uncharacterized protein n=3 Tax=Azospirillum thiophilum TaxID=528244 RepID=A0AAC8W5Y9_9PROT|nr:hypothetical protein AL072_32915 [Azospirillum thiophilum]